MGVARCQMHICSMGISKCCVFLNLPFRSCLPDHNTLSPHSIQYCAISSFKLVLCVKYFSFFPSSVCSCFLSVTATPHCMGPSWGME